MGLCRMEWEKRLGGKGRRIVLIGPTGSGKSSFLNLLLGWPALQTRHSPHTTRVPAIIRHAPERRLAFLTNGNRTDSPDRFWNRAGKGGKRNDKWIGVDRDSWVMIDTSLPWLKNGACLIDTLGFDGTGKHGGLGTDLAAFVRLWCGLADAILFVLDEMGLRMEGREEMLRACLKSEKSVAVFVNKTDLPDSSDEWSADAVLNSLRDTGVVEPIFFGCSLSRLAVGVDAVH